MIYFETEPAVFESLGSKCCFPLIAMTSRVLTKSRFKTNYEDDRPKKNPVKFS